MAIAACGTQASAVGRELIEHGTALFPVSCYDDALHTTPVPWHWHEELEVGIVAEGRMCLAIGDKRIDVLTGQGFFINQGVLHEAHTCENGICRIHSIVFHSRLVSGGMDSIFWQKYVRPLTTDAGMTHLILDGSLHWHADTITAIHAAWQSCADEPPGYEFMARAELSKIVFQLSGIQTQRSEQLSEKEQITNERVKQMLQYIQTHYTETITLGQLAQLVHISPSECLRCFHRVIGIPPVRFIKQYRIQQAVELLTHTQLSVGEVGAACGFEDASYFIRAFRELNGATPSALRKKGANAKDAACAIQQHPKDDPA